MGLCVFCSMVSYTVTLCCAAKWSTTGRPTHHLNSFRFILLVTLHVAACLSVMVGCNDGFYPSASVGMVTA